MEIINYIIICILCYLIAGIVHELGHVLIGLVNGWKFLLLIIGPFGIKANSNGKIKF